MYKITYLLFVIARIFVPLFIGFNPIFILVIVFILDAIDGFVASRKVISKDKYEKIDKLLDFYWYVIALIFSYFAFETFFITILSVLLLLRFIGTILFEFTGEKKWLIFFANYFENFFILILIGEFIPQLSFLLTREVLSIVVIIVFALKLMQEIWIHHLELSFMELVFYVKEEWKKGD